MMGNMEKRLDTPEGSLQYLISGEAEGEKFITITGCDGRDTQIRIPEEIEGLPVKSIKKKTFLSRKQLRTVMMPESIEEIGEWAFAYCTSLENVWLPRKGIKLGSGIFMECPGIRRIYVYREEGNGMTPGNGASYEEQTVALLAAAAVMLEAEYLLNPLEAGSFSWLRKWDARMEQIMRLEDGDGYTKMILCGEEDYGNSLEEFVANKRRSKVRLALLRLMNPIGLFEELKEEWKNYIITHTKGCASEEAWEVMLKEHGHEQEYFQLFAELGGVNEDNFDDLLKDMEGEHAEMKAFLIRYKAEKMSGGDFFDMLSF